MIANYGNSLFILLYRHRIGPYYFSLEDGAYANNPRYVQWRYDIII